LKTERKSLVARMAELPDPRHERTREHELGDLLVIAVCTLLVGGESFYDMEDFGHAREDWLRTFLRLPGGIPSHDTFNRLFQALDPAAFAEAFAQWTQGLRGHVAGEVVALDGKAARRATAAGRSPRHLVSAWATESGLTLGQLQVAEKSNEITAVPALLRQLELAGCIVTADALHCQKTIAKEIIEADADYVLALKGNQATAHAEVRAYLDDALLRGAPELALHTTVDKGHGRLETRRYGQSAEIGWFADKGEWEGLRSVGLVEATRETGGKTTVERRYYLSSLPVDAARFARAVRGHWAIENQCHWVLDVVFGEDQSRARTGHAVANLGLLRRLALNLLRRDKTCQRGAKGKQLNAALNPHYLLSLLSQ
jgi:predicted transposase YbfD/YdcC